MEIAANSIGVVVECLHPRVVYACQTVLGDFLGFAPTLLVGEQDPRLSDFQAAGVPVFSYTSQPSATLPNLPCCGLLYEDIIRQANEEIDWFGAVSAQMRLPDDLARIFFHLTQYALLQPAARITLDAHGRYPNSDGALVVHALLKDLLDLLRPHLRVLPPPRAFSYELTLDVDQPWKYLHKPAHVRWGGLLRDLLRGADTRERRRALRSGHDPFDVLATVRDLCPPDHTTVFFLVDGDHPHDSRFSLRQPAYQRYVQAYQQAGYGIGLHPSYASMDHAGILPAEKALLEGVAGPVTRSRQHYLRYRTPETFRALVAAGITRDYTLCRSSGPGAETGVAWPYPWFDLQRNAPTPLTLVPAMVMDRSLQQYMALEPAEALQEITSAIEKTRKIGGHFVIILHNETFSESGEWLGWLPVLREMCQLLRS